MNKKVLFHQIIVLLLMFGFKYLPPLGAMSPMGMAIAGIFVGAIYGWITIGMVFPNIAGIIALGFSGAYPSFLSCFQSSFGADTSVMMLGCLFICAFMETMNLTDIIIGYLLNLKIAKSNILMFFIIFFFAIWLVSSVTSSILAAVVFVTLYRTMTKEAGIEPHTKTNSFVLCGFALFAAIGEIAFPFRPGAVALLALLEGFLGEPFSFGFYLLYLTSFQVILIVLYVLIGRFILRVDLSKFKAVEVPKVSPNKEQRLGLWVIALMMVAFILASTNLPIFPKLGLGGVSLLTVAVMLLIQVDGQPLLKIDKLAGNFSWPIYLLICFFFAISGFIGSADAGITATIKSVVAPIAATLPPFAFIVFALVASTVLTNVLNNFPVAIIFISTMLALCDSLPSLNLTAACIAIIGAAYAACATPAANPVNAFMFSNTDLIDQKISLKIGSICCALICLFCIVIYYPLLSMLV